MNTHLETASDYASRAHTIDSCNPSLSYPSKCLAEDLPLHLKEKYSFISEDSQVSEAQTPRKLPQAEVRITTGDVSSHNYPHQHGYQQSMSNSVDPGRPDVEQIVYYFADYLEDILHSENYSIFEDRLRTIMIQKWMRFYSYHPGTPKELDKPRRNELKGHLNLPLGSAQKLGQFIIYKFNTFRKRGLISGDGQYHIATDKWLSRNWDGTVERLQDGLPRNMGLTDSSRPLQKRPASSSMQQDQRQKRLRLNAKLMTPTVSNDSTIVVDHHLLSKTIVDQGNSTNASNTSHSSRNTQRPEVIAIHSTKTDKMLDDHLLWQRVEGLPAETTTNAIQNNRKASCSGMTICRLEVEALREKERICQEAVRQSIKELKDAKQEREHLLQEYDNLRDHIGTVREAFKQSRFPKEACKPRNLAGLSEPGLARTLTELYQERSNSSWLPSKKAEISEIQKKIASKSEIESSLKARISAQKTELEQFQRDIKQKMEEDAWAESFESEIDAFFDALEDDRGSGLISPADSFLGCIETDSTMME